jgi:hypothetical protein
MHWLRWNEVLDLQGAWGTGQKIIALNLDGDGQA